jgi:preprotein translocase subunit SecE
LTAGLKQAGFLNGFAKGPAGATIMRFFKKMTSANKGKKNNTGRLSWFRRFKPRLPKYFSESIAELKKVTWPGRREAWKMTFAVFVFSLVFALVVVIVDFGIQIAAEELFL